MKEQKAKGAPVACAPGAGAADSRADANEYTQIVRNSSNQNPAHDKNGNMTSLPTRPATGAAAGTNVSTAITFDAFNRPFTAQAGGNGVQDYRYDALGRRIAAMELSGGNILAGRRFVWDSWSVATERLLSGTTGNCDSLLERCYVEGASLDEHLFAAIDGDLDGNLGTNLNVPVSAGTTNTNDYLYYYLPNRLGSVMGLLDATDDRYMLEFYRYTVYGEATVLPLYDTGLNQIEDTPTDLTDNNSAMLATRTGGGGDTTAGRASTFNNQYTFTGRYLDAETGLHYYRFRYYEARTGRFISRDPAESPWTNTYSYGMNCPTFWIDPFGLEPKLSMGHPHISSDGSQWCSDIHIDFESEYEKMDTNDQLLYLVLTELANNTPIKALRMAFPFTIVNWEFKESDPFFDDMIAQAGSSLAERRAGQGKELNKIDKGTPPDGVAVRFSYKLCVDAKVNKETAEDEDEWSVFFKNVEIVMRVPDQKIDVDKAKNKKIDLHTLKTKESRVTLESPHTKVTNPRKVEAEEKARKEKEGK